VSGSEAAYDVYTWMRTGDGRRFGKMANTPSLSRPSHEVTIDELPDPLRPTWDIFGTSIAQRLTKTSH
jgi:hypothetical protein